MDLQNYLILWGFAAIIAYVLHKLFIKLGLFTVYDNDFQEFSHNTNDFSDPYYFNYYQTYEYYETQNEQQNAEFAEEIEIDEMDAGDPDINKLPQVICSAPIIEEPPEEYSVDNSNNYVLLAIEYGCNTAEPTGVDGISSGENLADNEEVKTDVGGSGGIEGTFEKSMCTEILPGESNLPGDDKLETEVVNEMDNKCKTEGKLKKKRFRKFFRKFCCFGCAGNKR